MVPVWESELASLGLLRSDQVPTSSLKSLAVAHCSHRPRMKYSIGMKLIPANHGIMRAAK